MCALETRMQCSIGCDECLCYWSPNAESHFTDESIFDHIDFSENRHFKRDSSVFQKHLGIPNSMFVWSERCI